MPTFSAAIISVLLVCSSTLMGAFKVHMLSPSFSKAELSGGDYENGRSLFFGERLKCGSCHRFRGLGTGVAPELKSSISLLPQEMLGGLNKEELRDLLTFIAVEPPQRTRADLQKVLQKTARLDGSPAGDLRPLNIVLVASKQDHGAGQHDYPAWQKRWVGLLQHGTNLAVSEAWEWPSPAQFTSADVIVFYFWNHQWTDERYAELDRFLEKGGGIALFHAAVIADKDPEKLATHIGLAAQPGPTKYRHTPFVLKFTAPTNHPITTGFADLPLLDEPYWPMIGDPKKVEVLATAEVDGAARPMIWSLQKGRGRVFASIVGHYTSTFEDPVFRLLALRGISWAGGQSTRRLEEFADK